MEQNELVEGMPPQNTSWEDFPGDLVWKYEPDPSLAYTGMYGLAWQVRKLVPGKHFELKVGQEAIPCFQASTPYRACFYEGKTAEEALARLLLGFCLLSREGAINPNAPEYPGAPIVQHAIHILTERLLWNVEQRQRHLVMSGYFDNPEGIPKTTLSAEDFPGPEAMNEQAIRAVARDNEVVSTLATAIAALARVKDL